MSAPPAFPHRCGSVVAGYPRARHRGGLRDARQQPICGTAAGDLDVRVGQELRDALAQQHAVLDDGYPHGISALHVSPAAGSAPVAQPAAQCLDPIGEPATLCRVQSRTTDAVVDDSAINVSSSTLTSTETRPPAWACFAALVKLSETT